MVVVCVILILIGLIVCDLLYVLVVLIRYIKVMVYYIVVFDVVISIIVDVEKVD